MNYAHTPHRKSIEYRIRNDDDDVTMCNWIAITAAYLYYSHRLLLAGCWLLLWLCVRLRVAMSRVTTHANCAVAFMLHCVRLLLQLLLVLRAQRDATTTSTTCTRLNYFFCVAENVFVCVVCVGVWVRCDVLRFLTRATSTITHPIYAANRRLANTYTDTHTYTERYPTWRSTRVWVRQIRSSASSSSPVASVRLR